MANYKDFIYILLCLSLSMIIGTGVYEHIAVWPRAFMAPPQSLTMFQGDYALNPEPFWRSIHPATLLLFVITSFLTWKTERKRNVLIPFIGYVIALIATFSYYVPELMALISTKYEEVVNQELIQRGSRWEILSLIRLSILIVLSLVLFAGLTKPINPSKSR